MRRNNNKQDGEVKQKRRKQGKENSELSKGVEIANNKNVACLITLTPKEDGAFPQKYTFDRL